MNTDKATLWYLMAKEKVILRLIKCVLLHKECFEVKDRKRCINQVAQNLLMLEVDARVNEERYINHDILDELLMLTSTPGLLVC